MYRRQQSHRSSRRFFVTFLFYFFVFFFCKWARQKEHYTSKMITNTIILHKSAKKNTRLTRKCSSDESDSTPPVLCRAFVPVEPSPTSSLLPYCFPPFGDVGAAMVLRAVLRGWVGVALGSSLARHRLVWCQRTPCT